MKVLHLITSLAMGGAERFLLDLLTEQKTVREIEPFLALLQTDGEFYPRPELGHPILDLQFRAAWRDVRAVRRTVASLREFMRRANIDILHSHLWVPDYLGALAVRSGKTRHLSHIHNTWEWYRSRRPGFRFRKFVFRTSLRAAGTRFVSCSDAAALYMQQTIQLAPHLFRTIPYGVDTEQFTPGAEERSGSTRFGMAGRFVPEKGHEVLFKALRILKSRNVRPQVVIAGDGPLEAQLAAMIEEWQLSEQVRLSGRWTDMRAFYRGIDVLIQPSLAAEGLPVAILEAQSCGLPVITADVAGAKEAVADGRNGWIIPAGDPVLLADAVESAAKMARAKLREIGHAGRANVKARYARGDAAHRVAQAYHDLLARTW
jgi:glycosyltransferase involved in cell wall biosynthesis